MKNRASKLFHFFCRRANHSTAFVLRDLLYYAPQKAYCNEINAVSSSYQYPLFKSIAALEHRLPIPIPPHPPQLGGRFAIGAIIVPKLICKNAIKKRVSKRLVHMLGKVVASRS